MTQSRRQFQSRRCIPGERVSSDPAVRMDLSLQVGKYDVQKAIGKGATGTVYLAKDTFTGGEVALKTIEPEVFRDPEFGAVYRSQFQNEASLAGKLRHPHIVAILDAVVQKDSGHIAMEYVKAVISPGTSRGTSCSLWPTCCRSRSSAAAPSNTPPGKASSIATSSRRTP